MISMSWQRSTVFAHLGVGVKSVFNTLWCNGSTPDFESEDPGSNPGRVV